MQSNPYAITIDGEQYPSVSKILQSDPKRKTYYKSVGARRKQAFKDGDAAATGRHRGDSLHAAFAQYITTGEAARPSALLQQLSRKACSFNPSRCDPAVAFAQQACCLWLVQPAGSQHLAVDPSPARSGTDGISAAAALATLAMASGSSPPKELAKPHGMAVADALPACRLGQHLFESFVKRSDVV